MQLSKKLPDQAYFVNEYGDKVEIDVVYEWRPVTCSFVHQLGHETKNYRNNKKQIWRVKAPVAKEVVQVEKATLGTKVSEIDANGF